MSDSFPQSWQETLEQGVAWLRQGDRPRPTGEAMAQALVAAEKASRRGSETSSLPTAQTLAGTWRLGFVTGTKKSRERAGVVLGAGRFLPRWLTIEISYQFIEGESASPEDPPTGRVDNSVQLGPLQLKVSGPIRWFAERRILAFDFPQLQLGLVGITLFQGYIPQGQERERRFGENGHPRSLRDQAFFSYFLIQPDCIAARGRGGGLALWFRDAKQRSAEAVAGE